MKTTVRRRIPVAIVALIVVFAGACGSSKSSGGPKDTGGGGELPTTTLSGSGSSFQDAFDQEVFRAFSTDEQPNVTVNYNPTGSGQGQTDLQGGLVDFAGTDSLVSDADVSKFEGPFLYIPIVSAPITVSYNLSGVDNLELSAATIAKVFSSKVTKWDAPEIKADNPDATLPSTPIVVVHRSDGSGTTANFTQYLTEAAPDDWTLGSDKVVNWASTTIGAEKNTGVAEKIKGTEGAIGYVDFSDAKASALTFASIKNAAGTVVEPSLEGATAAMGSAEVSADVTVSPMNAPGDDAYPITSPTYLLVYETQSDHNKGTALKALLEYVLGPGQDVAASLDFAKLPAALLEKSKAQLDKIQIP